MDVIKELEELENIEEAGVAELSKALGKVSGRDREALLGMLLDAMIHLELVRGIRRALIEHRKISETKNNGRGSVISIIDAHNKIEARSIELYTDLINANVSELASRLFEVIRRNEEEHLVIEYTLLSSHRRAVNSRHAR